MLTHEAVKHGASMLIRSSNTAHFVPVSTYVLVTDCCFSRAL